MKRQSRYLPTRLLVWGVVAGLAALVSACGGEKQPLLSNTVEIHAEPEVNAAIIVDGTQIGETPLTLTNAAPGLILLQLKKEGYRDKWESVVVPPEGKAEITVPMELILGYLSITTEPPGASVVLSDGTELGTTPILRAGLPLGEYTYEIRLENHETLTHTVMVDRESLFKLAHNLKPRSATLVVFSVPTGASLWLNNQLQEERTPARLSVAPGTYTVTVHSKGYVMSEEVVSVNPNTEKRLELRMNEGNAPPGMLLIPGGEFIMGSDQGSPDERPARKLSLEAFYLDKYEVTNEQYKAVYAAHEFEEGEEDHPVTGVTWLEAVKYAETVGKRLPTEAEWEKAARGTDGREYPWGPLFDKTLCNSLEGSLNKTETVGTYLNGASPYGVMDMAGNVYEWVADWYNPYPGNQVVDKNYGQVYRVLRGGSFKTGAYEVRCLRRTFDRQDLGRNDYGFRCALDVNAASGTTREP
ncbi:MAG: hypothetical protein AMXMBFR84_02350 [Candidatus Hydrogenedentota bacterium]